MERQAHAQHAGLALPGIDQAATLRPLDSSPTHHRKALWVQQGSFQRQIVAISFPRWWDDDSAVDASRIHFLQQLIFP
jgi:hypothetical protein